MDYDKLFAEFIEDKKYIDLLTPKSILTYEQAWQRFKAYGGTVSTDGIKAFIKASTDRGLSPGGINTTSRSLNVFFKWMTTTHDHEAIKMPLLRKPARVLPTYSPDDANRVLNYHPKSHTERRLITALHLMTQVCKIRVRRSSI